MILTEKVLKGFYTSALFTNPDVEPECIEQVKRVINHPAFTHPIVLQPDCHAGKGCVIGFTMPMTDKVIPNIIGVDIGCGMLSFSIPRPSNLSDFDKYLKDRIPMGHNIHTNSLQLPFDYIIPTRYYKLFVEKFKAGYWHSSWEYNSDYFEDLCKRLKVSTSYILSSLGTLGGGNHFIEVGITDKNDIWCTIHTGSRNLGKRICDYHQLIAKKLLFDNQKKEIEKIIESTVNKKEIQGKIDKYKQDNPVVETGLEFLSGELLLAYMRDMFFAQYYAQLNRQRIRKIIMDYFKIDVSNSIESIHNYIDWDDLIIRKGAIRSYCKEKMIIPLNMRDGMLICEGKGNIIWNNSAPHGAGRKYSRSSAKKEFSLETFKQTMEGIYSSTVNNQTLDESPMAYKDSNTIKELIKETATIIDVVKPIYNVKAGDE